MSWYPRSMAEPAKVVINSKFIFRAHSPIILLKLLPSKMKLCQSLLLLLSPTANLCYEGPRSRPSGISEAATRRLNACLTADYDPNGQTFTWSDDTSNVAALIGTKGQFLQTDVAGTRSCGDFVGYDTASRTATYTNGEFCGAINAPRSAQLTLIEDCVKAYTPNSDNVYEPTTCSYQMDVYICFCSEAPSEAPSESFQPTQHPTASPSTSPSASPTTGP